VPPPKKERVELAEDKEEGDEETRGRGRKTREENDGEERERGRSRLIVKRRSEVPPLTIAS
jgi:hypothetical protein